MPLQAMPESLPRCIFKIIPERRFVRKMRFGGLFRLPPGPQQSRGLDSIRENSVRRDPMRLPKFRNLSARQRVFLLDLSPLEDEPKMAFPIVLYRLNFGKSPMEWVYMGRRI